MKRLLDENENFLGIPNTNDPPENGGVIILPVPFERTTSFGKGAALGPDAILAASHQVELRDAKLGFSPLDESGGIVTLPSFNIDGHDGQSLSAALEAEVKHWLDKGGRVVTLGGEHTSVVGTIRAHVNYYPQVTVLQLDAHSDLREAYEDDPWSHACAMKRVLDFHQDIVQVGIRSESDEDRRFNRHYNLPVYYGEDIAGYCCDADWAEEVSDSLSENVYITFDCDVFDPSIIPATGTPEPGGLSWYHIDTLLSRVSETKRIVGFDVTEFSPIKNLHHPQFTMAKLVYRLIGYMSKSGSGV